MSADKRSVTTDALATLDTIIESGGRDAIHLAVEPIVAAEKLWPGQDIGIVDGKASSKAEKKLGIVDPFVRPFVPEGSMFWLIIYPRQITSLRHVWEHPDFQAKIQLSENTNTITTKEEGVIITKTPINGRNEMLLAYAISLGVDYDDLIMHAKYFLEDDEYWNEGGRFDGEYTPEWFWDEFEKATGIKVEENKRFNFFSCSC